MASLPNGKTVALPTNTYQPGTFSSPKLSLAVGQSSILIEATRNSWPNTGADVVSVTVNISYDGGATFGLLAGFTSSGGVVTNPFTHVVDDKSSFLVNIPQPSNPNRQLQAIATVFAAINTTVSITVN